MKKTLLLLITLLCTCGAWAEVAQPTLTTDPHNPHYYTIKNYRSSKYATYVDAKTQLAQNASASCASLWYFVQNGSGVSIVPAIEPTLKLETNSSATTEGALWYLVENPYNAGYFCVSLTSGATANCWDDNSSHTGVGYWRPESGDYEGTSWVIEESSLTYSEVIDYRRNLISPYIEALPNVLRPEGKMTAFNSASTDEALREAVDNFSANVSFLCRSGNYLVVGDSKGLFTATSSDNEKIIQLESVGDGSFYLKGYMSCKYMADVEVSTAIMTESEASTPFYIQTVGDYAVARPTKWADSGWPAGYHYIHNGGSGCVGWESGGENTQFTIELVDIPDGMCEVTYNVTLDGEVIATSLVRQMAGVAPVVPTSFERDYTSYTYDVSTIPNVESTTVTATAYVSGLPFTVSTNYEDATWYNLQLHTTWQNYVSTNDDAILWKSGSENADKYYWAFMGNPVQGFTIINRATGASKYLSATAGAATMTDTPTSWIVKRSDDTHFGLWDDTRTYANGQGETIKYYGTFDAGSTFWVTEVPAGVISFYDTVAQLEAYEYGNELGQYSFTGDYAGYHGNEAGIISQLKSAGYSNENLAIAEGMLQSTAINRPTGKFVRFYSPVDKRYMGVSAASGYTTTESAIENAGIYYVNSINNENHVVSFPLGRYVANSAGATMAAIGQTGGTFTFSESATRGKYYVQNGGYMVSWNDDTNSYHINRLSQLSNAADISYGTWEIEAVEDIPVTFKGEYASFYSPVDLTIPEEGVEVYSGTLNEEKMVLTLNKIEGTLPANTGVILKKTGEESTVNFTVLGTTNPGESDLIGTVAAKAAVDGGALVLGKDSEGNWGIYNYTGALGGFKAYMEKPSNDVKGFAFNFGDADAIEEIVNGQSSNGKWYNLAGQRVEKATRGLYIVGGKKVVVK